MRRFSMIVVAVIFMMSLSAAAFAEPAQIASGVLEEAMTGACVRVSVDLADNWSVKFYPMGFYLYDQPAFEKDSLAYGTLLSEESYATLIESHADEELAERDGAVVFTASEGETGFIAPVGEGLYILLLVDPATEADAVWARVSCEMETFSNAAPAQSVSGVVAEAMDDSILVRVTLDLTNGWSARFYPMAFYLCSQDCENDEDFDAYGTLLNAEAYASVIESHTEDGTLTEKDGIAVYKADGYTGFIAPVAENEYITLLVYPPFDAEAMWARVAYELF